MGEDVCFYHQMKHQNRSRVLVADDSPAIRERLISLLGELPHVEVVGECGGAREALESIRKLRPSAVVLDISMPGGGGIHVLEKVKKEEQSPIVIMLTNFAHEAYRRHCAELGADYFFDKSNEFDKVIQVFRDRRNARRLGVEGPASAEVPSLDAGSKSTRRGADLRL